TSERGDLPAGCRCRAGRRTALAWQCVQGPACTQHPRSHAARPYTGGKPVISPTQERVVGQPLNRIDGPKKVTGTATYAYEHSLDDVTYAFPVQSTIAKGGIVSFDVSNAQAIPGVITILTHENAPRLKSQEGELAVLQSNAIAYRGQFVALVVAETLEVAR